MVVLRPRIVADENVCHGQAVIQGTRVPVSVVVGQLSAGMTIDEVISQFDVERDDVLAALAYAASVVAAEEMRSVG